MEKALMLSVSTGLLVCVFFTHFDRELHNQLGHKLSTGVYKNLGNKEEQMEVKQEGGKNRS